MITGLPQPQSLSPQAERRALARVRGAARYAGNLPKLNDVRDIARRRLLGHPVLPPLLDPRPPREVRADVTKPPREGGLEYTTAPFACVVCGKPDLRSLCQPCRLDHTDEAGKLHPAIADLQRAGKRLSDRTMRNAKRLRGTATKKDGQYLGVRFVSLEALEDAHAHL